MLPPLSIDLHGYRVKEAEEVFHQHLNEVRLNNQSRVVKFITGRGPIQERLKQLAQEQDLHHYVELANPGCLIIEFG